MTKTLTEQIVHIQNDIDGVFDEVVKLKKQLAIATKALKDVAHLYIYTDKDLSTVANNALKEMECVK